ncbi:MAG: hypothetical protein M5R36_27725 [Deltaproteobacteria bacterium]|nr:hypothetical protein [Deltaproteobacteria bacterium]
MKRISLVTICALAIAASVAARDAAVETFGRLSPGTALSAFPLRATRPAFDPSAPIVRIAAEDVEIAAETARIAALELGQKTAVVSAHVDLGSGLRYALAKTRNGRRRFLAPDDRFGRRPVPPAARDAHRR